MNQLIVSRFRKLTAFVLILSGAGIGAAQQHAGDKLVDALRHGGYVLVMRHASSPKEPPAKEDADRDNIRDERQLDEHGRATVIEMGNAVRKLNIPVGEVLSSPTFRALETARLTRLGKPVSVPELGENGGSMQVSSDAQAEWLRHRVTVLPSGTNTLLVTHNPNLLAAFPADAVAVSDGEALVFGPDGKGGATLAGRLKIEDWPKLRP